MNVLVAFASKHGSTRQIAEVIRDDLKSAGFNVTFLQANDVYEIDTFDGVILGSAIYIGQWQPTIMTMIDRFEDQLKSKHVWLFSSGPIGEDPFPKGEPQGTQVLIERTGALDHQSFSGKLDRANLGFGERIIVTALRAPEGDFRDWDVIRAWANDIARTLIEADVTSEPAMAE